MRIMQHQRVQNRNNCQPARRNFLAQFKLQAFSSRHDWPHTVGSCKDLPKRCTLRYTAASVPAKRTSSASVILQVGIIHPAKPLGSFLGAFCDLTRLQGNLTAVSLCMLTNIGALAKETGTSWARKTSPSTLYAGKTRRTTI